MVAPLGGCIFHARTSRYTLARADDAGAVVLSLRETHALSDPSFLRGLVIFTRPRASPGLRPPGARCAGRPDCPLPGRRGPPGAPPIQRSGRVPRARPLVE